MLHLDEVRKTYRTGTFTQAALDGVTITFRDNEFVAVLGPSGSGKTTLLNIVGGLDHADSGDLVIDQVSTKQYAARDWDTYRNNRIGFVFQNYNLIPHQTVLANVELALTLSGVSRSERAARAEQALAQVDLTEHMHKLPNQLSGGQMQRVAIARALINDPEILLADEPTGALDSKTGVQVMNLLQGIARDRLVIMVTHNPELADQYANRIVSLRDGQVVADTRPYVPGDAARVAKPVRRTSMSFLTAIALSFTNLMTKKGRTLMTSFAGSIGIIGIALILALANGLNVYIRSVEENTLSVYPLSIQTQGIDLTSMLTGGSSDSSSSPSSDPTSTGEAHETKLLATMFSHIGANDLASLKTFLDSPASGIAPYVNSIQYNYSVTPQIFASDTTDGARQVNPNSVFSALGMNSTSSSSVMSMGMSTNVFSSLPDDMGLLAGQYDLVAGQWPQNDNECLLVLSSSGGVSDFVLYAMGLLDPAQLTQMVTNMAQNKPIDIPTGTMDLTYDQLMSVTFKVVNATAFYELDPTYQVWTDKSKDAAWMTAAVNAGEPLKVAGVVVPDPAATATMLRPGLYYPASLVRHLMAESAASRIVQQQLANPTVNVFSGKTFAEEAQNPTMADFDFSSILNVDPEALTQMFSFDSSSLQLSLPSLDFSSLALNLPTVAPPDLTQILGSLNLSVSPDALASLLSRTIGTYLKDMFGVTIPDLSTLTTSPLTTSPQTATTVTVPPLTTSPLTTSGVATAPLATSAQTAPQTSSSASPVLAAPATATEQSSPGTSAHATAPPLGAPLTLATSPVAVTPPTDTTETASSSTPSGTPSATPAAPSASTGPSLALPPLTTSRTLVHLPLDPAPDFTDETTSEQAPDPQSDPVLDPPTQAPDEPTADPSPQDTPTSDPGSDATPTEPTQPTDPTSENPAITPSDDVTGTQTGTLGGTGAPTTAPGLGASAPTTTPGIVLPTWVPSDVASAITSALDGSPIILPSGQPMSFPTGLPTTFPTALPTSWPTTWPSLPSVNDIVTSFTTWFAQPDVQAQFMSDLAQVIDLNGIETHLASALAGYMRDTMTTMVTQMMSSLQTQLTAAMRSTMTQVSTQLASAMSMDPSKLSSLFSFTMDPGQLTTLLMSMMNNQANTLDSNLSLLGYADAAKPYSIDIYPKDFAAKQQVLDILTGYNDRMTATGQPDKVVTYTDIVAVLMGSVTDIVNKISAVLVAFVSISLVVSSIMIGIITYISVLERRKEIGILRALGASKRDIANVFNAETLIVGFVAGLMGVLITLLLTVIANPIIYTYTNVRNMAKLPVVAGVALIAISMALTFIAGLIPSSAASRRDPVEALRSE
ncbi:MAG: ATP-binding cassette domain-containing protein [Propionibacteriaceae bacterium]|nr:ATP-binding cassette domain-containing protein [Propionibacteriaceae bacterium]